MALVMTHQTDIGKGQGKQWKTFTDLAAKFLEYWNTGIME
jgi:hypothetical protein